jgi:hypothetical protein
MSMKQINIYVPFEEKIPEIIQTFTPSENALMLRIGCECIQNARIHFSELSQEEIYLKMKKEMDETIKIVERDLLLQKEINRQMKENEHERTDTEIQRIIKVYKEHEQLLEKKYEKMQGNVSLLKEELKSIDMEKSTAIQQGIAKEREKYDEKRIQQENQYNKLQAELKEIELEKTIAIQQGIAKEREKYDIWNQEKTHLLSRLTDNYEKITNKTSTVKGIEGERTFCQLTNNTFRDFKGFEIIDKTKQSEQGDFYLKFEEFEILADAKNYKKSVPSGERDKIKSDLKKNEHIPFAWLVSLNTSIDKFDKSPIMFEWITTQKCIVYINNLLQYEDPSQILRIAWFSCRELLKLTKDTETDITELTSLRDTKYKMIDKIKNIRKYTREMNTTIGTFKKQVEMLDSDLKNILEIETNQFVESHYTIFDNWWKQNICIVNDSQKILKSTNIWTKFKKENKEIIDQFNLNADQFKEYIKTQIPITSYEMRSNANGALDIKGVAYTI